MASSVTKEARDTSTKGYGTSPNERSGKNKHSGNKELRAGTENEATKEGLLYYGDKQKKELLCLWRIWTHGSTL